jgi:hypothetical protein
MNELTPEQWWDQVIKLEVAFADLFGFFPTYWRPPYTECNELCHSNLDGLGYHVVCRLSSFDGAISYPPLPCYSV